MRGRILSAVLVVVVVLSSFLTAVNILPESVKAATLYVGGGGPGNYTKIQDAIDASNPGDTVYVFNGIYDEDVRLNKTISLVGEDRNQTVINSTGSMDVLNVTSSYVNVSGFAIKNASWGFAGLKLYNVSNCHISNNDVINSYRGIDLVSSQDNQVLYNFITTTGFQGGGIYLSRSHSNSVIGNMASGGLIGLRLFRSDFNIISENTATDLNEGGIALDNSHNNTISRNTLADSNNWGVTAHHSNDTTIIDNIIRKHNYGITLWGCNRAFISNNTYSWINIHGIDLYYSNHINITGTSVGVRIRFSNYTTILNSMVGGILVEGDLLEHWNTHIISDVFLPGMTGMTPVVYWRNVTGGTIPLGAGEIILANCTEVEIGNQIVDAGYMGIGIGFSSNISVVNNAVYVDDGDGITLYASSDSKIDNNDILTDYVGISLDRSDGNIVTDNTAARNSRGVQVSYSHGNYIARNNLSSTAYPIVVAYSDNNTILDNQGSDCHGGFSFDGSNYNTFMGNNASFCNGDGFGMGYSAHNLVLNNRFSNNGRYGMEVGYSDNNTFDGNIVSWSALDGLWLALSDSNTITNNTVTNNEVGLRVILLDNSTIANNTIAGNLEGVNLTNSNNNSVYHNNISFNILQAYDDTDTNQWDNGYPSGGNYWSDYSGIDDCSGPNQDVCPDPDVIGDTPYIIDADSQDRYPLMFPYGTVLPRPPTFQRAFLSGNDWENVTLVWALSPDDGSGYDTVVGYEIHRNASYNAEGLNYQLIASLPSGASLFVDGFSGEGDPNNYYYQICAIDILNNITCSKTQASKFTRQLMAGAHLVSVPLIQFNMTLTSSLQTVSYDAAWTYSTTLNEWLSFVKSKPYHGQLKEVNHLMALWVNVTNDSNFTTAGLVPMSTDIQLRAGWSLVGFPSFNTTYLVADLNIETGATRVETFDSSVPPYFLKALQGTDFLQAGHGYWVYSPSATIWTISN